MCSHHVPCGIDQQVRARAAASLALKQKTLKFRGF